MNTNHRTTSVDPGISLASRRQWLAQAGGGFGGLVLAGMLAESAAADSSRGAPRADLAGGLHHRARARRVVQLFMNGGVSQVDTFDYKPELIKRDAQQVDFGIKASVTGTPGPVMKSPFAWKRYGQCGQYVTSVLPSIAEHVDSLALLLGLQSKSNVHGPASYLQNTGFVLPGFPCMGAWISYALGSATENLPTFVVLPDARGLPYNNTGNFSPGFLPAAHAGTIIRPSAPAPIANLHPPAAAKEMTPQSEQDGLALLAELNRSHAAGREDDSRLAARMHSFELAAKMQLAAPEVLDLSRETPATLTLYGIDQKECEPFGRNCLLARRMLERGVRFVQVWSGAGGPSKNWDNHSDIPSELPAIARSVDRPIAGLLTDLAQRGLLEDTLVIFATEFGRMPFTQNKTGRDHNALASVAWLAGAGVRGGVAYGETDEFGYQAVRDKTDVHDFHATILHLLGIDHTRLTFRHDGIDRRLTDVHGHVLHPLLL